MAGLDSLTPTGVDFQGYSRYARLMVHLDKHRQVYAERPRVRNNSPERHLIVLVAVLLGCGVVTGCGSTSPRSASRVASNAGTATTSTSANGFKPRKFGDYDNDDYYNDASHGEGDNDDHKPTDRDGDSDNPTNSYYDSDDNSVRFYGHAVSDPERHVISALVERYYAAAAAENGATACTMISAPIVDSIPETLGGPAGPPYLQGNKTCAKIVSRLFAQNHEQLSTYDALLHVDGVRRSGDRVLVIMRFRGHPARQIAAVDEHGSWKIQALLDDELP